MPALTFNVDTHPPLKQTGNLSRRNPRRRETTIRLQRKRRRTLQRVARGAMKREGMAIIPSHEQNVRIKIIFRRNRSRADATNIIGGILDGLEGIVYKNDRQVTRIEYSEEAANDGDSYGINVENN